MTQPPVPTDGTAGASADGAADGAGDGAGSDAAAARVARRPRTRRIAGIIAGVLAAALLVTVGVLWQRSLIPDTYSVMSMGGLDYGGGPVPADGMAGMDMPAGTEHAAMGSTGAVDVSTLIGPDGSADVSVTLTARSETIELGGATPRSVTGYTLNHESPGPQITVTAGELLEVTVVNESVADGIAMHWHGVDVPNGEDGVAGVTQDAIDEGESFVYRFVVPDAGTYWYHSHQVADEQVARGLFGALVVLPEGTAPTDAEAVAMVHTYSGIRTVNAVAGTVDVAADAGTEVRVRVVNTNNGPLRTWVTGSPYTVLAIDGQDLHEPGIVNAQTIVVPAGGRADLLVTAPADGSAAAVNLGGEAVLAVGPVDGGVIAGPDPGAELDLLTYGTATDIGFDPEAADRHFEYRIGRRVGFLDGRPGFWWTINGGLYPDVPSFVVQEGDVVQMTITNSSGELHPMHLHGHHAVVLSRDGVPSTGSPLWVDSVDVLDGETLVLGLVADNPGIWMDHCHNLEHASQGLVTHLMYAGVSTPFLVGGEHSNDPE